MKCIISLVAILVCLSTTPTPGCAQTVCVLSDTAPGEPPVLDRTSNENIEIVLNGSGTGCYVGEPYWLDVLVINISNDTLTIEYPSPEDDLMHFDGSFHDMPLHYEGIHVHSKVLPTVDIPPGDTVYRVFNFWESFLYAEKWGLLPKTGTVKLTARIGGVISNEISFKIEQPTGP